MHYFFRKGFNRKISILILFMFNMLAGTVSAQPEAISLTDTITSYTITSADSTIIAIDSIGIGVDTTALAADSVQPKKTMIDAEIAYQASDSIVFYSNGKAYMYGQSVINYKEIELKANYIEMDMDSTQVYARGVPDTLGNILGNPIFKEGSEAYESRTIKYNFKTKKGYINHVVTQQGEGYVVSERTKKTADDMLYMKDGRYTTCSNHEHPHFYLNLTKAKVKPKSFIVTGPAYLVMEDVPLPLAIPFGFFPFTDSYSSGLLMPSFGDEMTRGFFLRDGGYYFALSDYFDLAVTGDIYTKGSWALRGASTYVKRYKFSGNFSANYQVTVNSEKDLPDYSKAKSFSVNWVHRQDPKANLYRTLSANVSYSSSSYERNNISNYYNPQQMANNTKSSSVTLSQTIPNSPWKFQLGMRVDQIMRDSTINLELPSLSITMSRIYPFKRKVAVGKERWYEKIAMSYTGNLSNRIKTKESEFKNSSFSKDWENGMKHSIPISASFNLFKYITITPSAQYTERWYLASVKKEWDFDKQQLVARDTSSGFYRVYDFDFGVSAQTKLYGFFKPSPKIFGDKINTIRWVLTPSVGFSMRPDFGAETFGYWNKYIKHYTNGNKEVAYYSPYEGRMYGVPAMGESGNINFSLGNNVEMKVKSKNDSIGLKKISLIDNFSLSSSYNLMADSMNLSNISASLRLKFTEKFGINLSGQFDPYQYKIGPDGRTPYRSADYRWQHGKMPQFMGTSTSFGYAFNNDTFKKKSKDENTDTPPPDGTDAETETQSQSLLEPKKDETERTAEGYVKYTIPWNLSFDYTLNYTRSDFNPDKMKYDMHFTHNMSVRGDLSLTKKWRMSFSASYDITLNQLNQVTCNITRDLHCWSLTASINPVGYIKSYMITIRVNSSLLQDLKYEQRGNSNRGVW